MAVALAGGTYELGPEHGTLLVNTGREGPAALAGHDLTIEVSRWAATVVVDTRMPARSTVTATADPSSLVVLSAQGGVAPLTESQKGDIARIIRETVLQSSRHRTIAFESAEVEGDLRRGVIRGRLALAGRTRPVTFDVVVAASRGASTTVTATADIAQKDFGITPYAAMLGALRVRDVVRVTITARLPTRPAAARVRSPPR
jgi:polyisoprenoid-binding protein YceI